ncbi:Probable carboxylesterase 2, partial [Linum perenne]
ATPTSSLLPPPPASPPRTSSSSQIPTSPPVFTSPTAKAAASSLSSSISTAADSASLPPSVPSTTATLPESPPNPNPWSFHSTTEKPLSTQSQQPTRTHGAGNGPEPWLNEFADFNRIFLAGDSAGGNIVHNLAMGLEVDLLGAALVHPYFWGSEPIGSESVNHLPEAKAGANSLWPFICPSNPDNDDPRVNPVAEDGPGLVGLGCRRVLVCVAEKDVLRDRGWMYYQALGRSGWMGVVEMDECEDEGHGFHLYNLDSENAEILIKRLAAFFNRDMPPLAY